MTSNDLDVNTGTWSDSSKKTGSGKTNNDDLVNDIFTTLGDFVNSLSPIFFLDSIQNFQTAIENFGDGMSKVLACVSVDLQVVSSGLASAAVAYAATDKNIASTFAQLNNQLSYYTNTATSPTALARPSADAQAALQTSYQHYMHPDTGPDVGHMLLMGGLIVGGIVVIAAAIIFAGPIIAAGAAVVEAASGAIALIGGVLALF